MALTKANAIQALQDRNGYSRAEAQEHLKPLFETIKGTLFAGEDMTISGVKNYAWM